MGTTRRMFLLVIALTVAVATGVVGSEQPAAAGSAFTMRVPVLLEDLDVADTGGTVSPIGPRPVSPGTVPAGPPPGSAPGSPPPQPVATFHVPAGKGDYFGHLTRGQMREMVAAGQDVGKSPAAVLAKVRPYASGL